MQQYLHVNCFINMVTLLGIAIAPGFAIIVFILYRDKFNREPASVLLVSFLWGVAATIPAIGLEIAAGYFKLDKTINGTFAYAFLGVALVEELVKFIPLRFYSFTRRSFDEPLDGIVHGVMIGMGFAMLENIGYVLDPKLGGIGTGVARMFLSVPGHASYGAIMGYYVGKAKFNYERRGLLLFTGLILATFFHGLYDGCLFVSQQVIKSQVGILVLGALATNIFAFVLALRLIRQHRKTSRNLYTTSPVFTIRNATVEDISLIRTLARQIWPPTYDKILQPAQVKYMMNLIYSEAALEKQMASGHQFIVIYNSSIPVGFASFSEVEPAIYKLQKVYVLINQQGRGTGRFAIDQVIAAIRPKGATALRLNVNRFNQAKGFYEKMGFAVISEEKIDIGSGYEMDDYVMEKSLEQCNTLFPHHSDGAINVSNQGTNQGL